MTNLDGLGYKGMSVVVTGASSGMGQAVASILHSLGARIHTVDIRKPSVPCETWIQADLSDPDAVEAAIASLVSQAPFQSLFACAGVPHNLGPLTCMLVNYVGARFFVEGMVPYLERGSGVAVIASDAAMAWQKNMARNMELLQISSAVQARQWCEAHSDELGDGYSFSKEMITLWVQHSSIALGQEHGLRINCSWPCPTGTAFIDKAEEDLGNDYFARFPYPLLGRMATADEQAWPLILLNSPLNNVVTGAVLYTDQGFAGGLYTGALDGSGVMGG